MAKFKIMKNPMYSNEVLTHKFYILKIWASPITEVDVMLTVDRKS